jgi:hypothetical protein
MDKFSENDLDLPWSASETNKLSYRDLTILAFKRDCKNAIYFFPQAIILYLLAKYLGVIGQVIGWIGIVLLGLFTIQNIFNFFVGVFVLITTFKVNDIPEKSSIGWKSLAVLLSFANVTIYSLAVAIICAGIYQWNI